MCRECGRRYLVAVALTSVLAASVLVGCGGSSDAPGDEGSLTAVDVGQKLKAAGAPITRPVKDTTFESRWADYPGLTSDAETGTRSVDLAIEVYDTPADRAAASTQQRANLSKGAPYSLATAECAQILISTTVSKKPAQASVQKGELEKIQRALTSAYKPC